MIDLRALTLVQPMGWAIVSGRKDVENRVRPLPKWMQGRATVVAVHGGLKYDRNYEHSVKLLTQYGMLRQELPPAARATGIIGLMRLTGRQFTEERPATSAWFSGPFGYEIAEAVALDRPVACRGGLGWWRVPRDLLPEIRRAAPAHWRSLTP